MGGGEMDGWGGILQRVGQDDKGRGERKTEICSPHTSHSGPDRWVRDTRRHMHVWLKTLKRRRFHGSWLHNISSSLNSVFTSQNCCRETVLEHYYLIRIDISLVHHHVFHEQVCNNTWACAIVYIIHNITVFIKTKRDKTFFAVSRLGV